ncbi:hypothetical protein [uncultured Megasphaera sp.]|uniref:hypothetical protein n=1 Tax=uncultured Megasphaera sp. TaxID=165188 RepID=UPI00260E1D2F|nr:hypothetical protein [uncultured Megasphaera sp.]
MIDDKMAKRAVNTLIVYCNGKKCADCAVSRSCKLSNGKFKYFDSYPLVGVFGNLQKPSKKPPKFDITLKDSTDFREYINEIFMREAEKAGLPMNTANSIKWHPSGKIKVTFVDDDNKTSYIGVAKCHPNDAFNPEVGVKLAIERAVKQMREPFIPNEGEVYYYVAGLDEVYDTINYHEYKDILNIALGNCFKTLEKALDNTYVIMRRAVNAIELLKKCRDDNAEDS